MSDQVERRIDEAAAALRDQTATPVSELEAARTRARILATHRRGRERGAGVVTWLAAAAAILIVLGGSTAWAYWTGRLDAWIGAPRAAESVQEATPTRTPHDDTAHARRATPTVTGIVPVIPVAPPATSTETETATETVVADVDRAASSDPVAELPPEEGTRTRAPVDPRERAAYRAAHTLHFEQHDPAGAIAAWDGYLAEYPSGRFALEARYNRALCLVRLGRTSEAREALAPFVAGTHGGYRQSEATALVQALDAP